MVKSQVAVGRVHRSENWWPMGPKPSRVTSTDQERQTQATQQYRVTTWLELRERDGSGWHRTGLDCLARLGGGPYPAVDVFQLIGWYDNDGTSEWDGWTTWLSRLTVDAGRFQLNQLRLWGWPMAISECFMADTAMIMVIMCFKLQ